MDHPMNTVILTVRPDLAAEAESMLGKPLSEIFPTKDLQMKQVGKYVSYLLFFC
jgi:arylformamidase